MNSKQLNSLQEQIEGMIKHLLDEPIKDFKLIDKYLDILKDIDSKRRLAWDVENFKDNIEIVDEYNIDTNFTSDDIPF